MHSSYAATAQQQWIIAMETKEEEERAELLEAQGLLSPTSAFLVRRKEVALVCAFVGLMALVAFCMQRQPVALGESNSLVHATSLVAQQRQTQQPAAFQSDMKHLESWLAPYEECYPPGWNTSNATPVALKVPPNSSPKAQGGISIFCWAFILPASKTKEEKELLEVWARKKIGPFGCDEHVVYGVEPDVVGRSCVRVIPGLSPWVPKVPKYLGGGRVQWNRANTPVFRRLWETVVEDGLWKKHDWTIKLDPDTTFLPNRMRAALEDPWYKKGASQPNGAFLTNCGNQVYGGAEVISRKAMAKFAKYVSKCFGSPREDEWWAECLRRQGIWGLNAAGTFCLRGCNCNYQDCSGPQSAWHAAENIWEAERCSSLLLK